MVSALYRCLATASLLLIVFTGCGPKGIRVPVPGRAKVVTATPPATAPAAAPVMKEEAPQTEKEAEAKTSPAATPPEKSPAAEVSPPTARSQPGESSPAPAEAKKEETKVEAKKDETPKTKYEIKVPTNAELAANLKGHLLLVHGDMDNNVHPANTIRLVDALIKANKRFDMLILPGKPHAFGDEQPYFTQRMWDFFAEHLLEDRQTGADIYEKKAGRR